MRKSWRTQHCRNWNLLSVYESYAVTLRAKLNLSRVHPPTENALWRSGLVVARWSRSTKITYIGPGWYWDSWPCPGSLPGAGHLSRYITSHPGQLSLAIPSWVGAMSARQRATTLCGWGVKAGMVRVWVAGKTAWSPCYTRAISERFRDAARRSSIWIHVTLLLCLNCTWNSVKW